VAAFGPTMTWGFGCISVAVGVADYGSALTPSPFSNAGVPAQQKGNRKGLLLRPSLAGSRSFAALPCAVSGCARRSLRSHAGSVPPLSLPTSPVDQDQEQAS